MVPISMQEKIIAPLTRQGSGAGQVSRHNLPVQFTPLIGREREVQAVCTLLQCPEVRLVTLIGPGGVGKTRLGLQVAAELSEDFTHDIYFVPLAPVSDPNQVVFTLAQTLELKEAGEQSLLGLLKAFIRDKHFLLLLDNFEQVVAAAPRLSDLLMDCPQLKILVTSRAVLRIRGEYEFPVSPLAIPDLKRLPDLEALSQYAAIALFIQRAHAIKPNFQLTRTNARALAEICARLDGLPLAIELAAARIKLLPPQALLVRLEHRLQLLTTGVQNMPARQQTLRNTIAWSYNLLDAQEQQLFRRLSIFVGGCTLEAAEAVCNGANDVAMGVLEGVTTLIDKSLLQQVEQVTSEGEEPRLMMLETIREYGLECLVAGGEWEITRHAHAAYYLTLIEEAKPELLGPQQAMWLERLEREHDNLCTALHRLIEQGEAGRDMEMALRLGGALLQFWDMSGPSGERQDFLERERTAPLLFLLARASAVQGDHATARSLGEEGLALVKEMTDKRHIASSLEGLAGVAAAQGEAIWAARLAGAGESLRETIGTLMPAVDRVVYEHTLAPIRAQLGEKALAIAWAEGRTMTLEQALMAREAVTMPAQVSSALPAITAKTSPTCPAGFTAREVEVLRLVAQGMTDAQVAERLVISPRTVNWHLTSIYSKLGISSRSAATRYAVEQHIV